MSRTPEEKVDSAVVSFRADKELVERIDRSAAAMSRKTGLSVDRSDRIKLAIKRDLEAEEKASR